MFGCAGITVLRGVADGCPLAAKGMLIFASISCPYINVNTGTKMIFEWDDDKARTNIAKHHVSFELAKRVWDDPLVFVGLDDVVGGEQ